MRVPMLACLCVLALAGCGTARNEAFTATSPTAFLYSAHSNTVMSENDDGVAERLRREWLADAVQTHGMCPTGYAVDTRRFMPDAEGRFGNGGNILYSGRCLSDNPPPAPMPVQPAPTVRGERG